MTSTKPNSVHLQIFAIFAALLLGISVHGKDVDRPNILFLFTDDHALNALSAYGGPLTKIAPTPHLDRIAKEGMLFRHCLVSNSICAPSRATIITGQYAHTCGSHDLGGRIEPQRQYLAKEMKKAGYHTAMMGKWHLKMEPAAFDFYSVLPGQGKFHDPEFRVQGDKPWPKNLIKFDGMHSSDAVTDQTLKWLKEGWNDEKPFFVYLCTNAVLMEKKMDVYKLLVVVIKVHFVNYLKEKITK